jgi:hypothetical protein
MKSRKIILLDHEKTHIDLLSGSFSQDGFECVSADKLTAFSGQSVSEDHLMVLINYQTLIQSGREEVVAFFKSLAEKSAIVYNVPENASQRMAFYELGALRVFGASYSIEEIYFSAGWIMNQLLQQDKDQPFYSSGSLRDFPLTALLQTLGKEKKNGVLKVITAYNSGNIIFQNGEICDAQAGMHRGLGAFLHMLSWEAGFFSFTGLYQPQVNRTITVSNTALFILAESHRKKYRSLFKEFYKTGYTFRLKNSGDLQQARFDINQVFIAHLVQPRPIQELLENPYYTCYETLEILKRLKESGFLDSHKSITRQIEHSPATVISESATMEVMTWMPEDTALFRNLLDLKTKKSAKLIIFCAQPEIKTSFISQIAKTRNLVRSHHSVDVAEIRFDPDFELYLVGLALDQMAVDTLDTMTDGLAGYIFLIDGHEPDQFEYNNYIMNQLLNLKAVPGTAAVYNLSSETELINVQARFNLPVSLGWIHYIPGNAQCAKRVLLSFKPAAEEIGKEA